MRLDSIATHTMLLDNMAQAHNQALQSQATHSQNRSDCQPDMKIAEAYGRDSELRSTLQSQIGQKFRQGFQSANLRKSQLVQPRSQARQPLGTFMTHQAQINQSM